MTYLLDTHTLLFTILSPTDLSASAKSLISDPTNEITVSPVSFWEISIKYSLGRLLLKLYKPDDFPLLVDEMGISVLDVLPEDLASIYKLPSIGHKDPFDRLLIWQAIRHGLTLISCDSAFGQYRVHGLKTLW